ncbi:hypothetical protein B6D52_01675, partial [Candidatus Parcubacteria bacterium 4484_255]
MLAKFIKQQRAKRNMTQEYLASELGISRPTYIQIERGGRELTVSEAKKLAAIFDMSLENFLVAKEPKFSVTIEEKSIKKSNNLQIRVTKKNLDKFKQVLLYILNKIGGKPNIGETVLHKLLYFIDFDYYEKFEENLMGATYIKNHHGPTSIELGEILKEMQRQGEIEAVKSQYFKYLQKKYLPRKRPNLDMLSAREIEHIDGVLARLSDKNAAEIENYSHEDIPWKSAQNGKPLSYESVFYRDERYSTEFLRIVKARLFCRYLKGSSLRIVYSYFEQERR